jgi:hypothetical protein
MVNGIRNVKAVGSEKLQVLTMDISSQFEVVDWELRGPAQLVRLARRQ